LHFKNLKIPWNTVRFKLISGVLIVFVPLILFLIYNNYYAITVIHNQVAQSNKNMVSLYMKEIDNTLAGVDQYLSNIIGLNKDLQTMVYSNDKNNYTLAKISLRNKISEDIFMFEMINSIFLYSEHYNDLVELYNGSLTYQQKTTVREFIKENLQSEEYGIRNNWYLENIEGEYYLLRLYKYEDSYIGAWSNVKELLIPMNLIDIGKKGTTVLTNEQGLPMVNQELIYQNKINLNRSLEQYFIDGEEEEFLIVGQKSSTGNFSLIALIPSDKILEKLPYLQRVIWFIVIGSLILLPVFLYLLRRVLLYPLWNIYTSMRRVHQGDLDVRIADFATSSEFKTIYQTFNEMMDEIKQLRINVYEEKLDKQRAELKHLQLQVNPHFFLNSLNIIYNLAQSKKFDSIMEISRSLVYYFRFMFRSNLSFVSLNEEIEHTKHYLRIQKLRFPKRLNYHFDIDKTLLDAPVPPLVIQTFVENSIKHGLNIDKSILINIKIRAKTKGDKEYIKIVISDTGTGFKDEVLERLQRGEIIIKDDREHVGIWNIRRRLDLLYNESTDLEMSNRERESGVLISILLPVDPEIEL